MLILVFRTEMMNTHFDLLHSDIVNLSLELCVMSTKCQKCQSHARWSYQASCL